MSFSAKHVNSVVRELVQSSRVETQNRWLSAVAARVTEQRPDLASELVGILGAIPSQNNPLASMSIGEIGACYEALLALTDRKSRKDSGQFFTPDDAAHFMALQSRSFPSGQWIDPACGVGNLAWHLADVQEDSAYFVAHSLSLVDKDDTALKTAIALIGADFLDEGDTAGLWSFQGRAVCANFLTSRKVPDFDFAILNPPYARAPEQRGYHTSTTRDFFAYFLERVSKSASGMIAVTPAGYLSAPKFQVLRDVMEQRYSGGRVYVFDNVPDTVFRGYKYGSTNTSTTNFVRAAITVCEPEATQWRLTPIIRWKAHRRAELWEQADQLLSTRYLGPFGEWAKLLPDLGQLWDELLRAPKRIAHLTCAEETSFHLDVGLTPRYYISAAFRFLDRGSKATLYFPDEASRDLAALVLNSSLPYLWWRTLDGGVTFPRRLLMSVPIPSNVTANAELVEALKNGESDALVVKLNAGRRNENVKHCPELLTRLDAWVLPNLTPGQRQMLYSNSMFPLVKQVNTAVA